MARSPGAIGRETALSAIAQIRPWASAVVTGLGELMDHEDDNIRHRAADALDVLIAHAGINIHRPVLKRPSERDGTAPTEGLPSRS
jgi:hypothetical protein